ncbi:hypothetical protein IC762_09680 [Bradyrhizobium genosp. L]|uniref:Ig-like domain-containing protein n=1 Tax=Bradyrhizobium genosp. L TaxID=83637 RepID=UPI0018A27544|nr:Ig-like domain-containing protein [Bradyrhizobium genosp. L]QPF86525.1 hypothetical protein IC762_09680 [Bradyrhizobium genosp. L]
MAQLLNDGSANAPAGVAQFSSILNGYAVRPDWKVAGVDYYVGTPSGTALKDPATISMAGVSVDKSNHIVTVSNSNVTLNGYDFGLSGGWQVNVVNNANNVTIENSSFKVGANNLMPIQAYYGGTINVLNNTFDGGASGGSSVNAMVFTGNGGATIEYNRFTNFPDDGVDITHDGNYVVQYNVFDSMGAGSFHTDAIQTYFSAVSSLSIQYNTMYEPPSMSNGGMNSFVRIGDQQGNVVHNPVAAYNTVIMASTNAETANVFQWDQGGAGTLVNPSIHDNFIDPKGVMYAVVSPTLQNASGIINPVTYNNVDLTTGKPLLSGLYNNNTSGVPTKAPAAPAITGESALSATQVKLSGTAAAGTTVDIYDQGSLLGSVKAGTTGSWTFSTPQLTSGDHSFTARATDSYANSSAASAAFLLSVTGSGPTTPTGPGTPTIASYTNDSGVVGDGITNDNTLTLTGSAAANSTVKVFDGASQIGTATASSTGTWSYTTTALADGVHSLTVKVTDTSGQTSAASTVLAVKIDTVAPSAPSIAGSTVNANAEATLTGTAEANSTVKVFDGATQIGVATANGSGAWSLVTPGLATGTHTLTAKATDAAGNTSAASGPVYVSSTNNAPTAPKIVSFSNDSGVANDGITNDSTLAISGTAAANATVKVFDGTTQIGTATTGSSGTWTFTTGVLADGNHSFTAKATNASGSTSTASAALAVKIDTTPPAAPTMTESANAAASAAASTKTVSLTGHAEADSTVKVFDGTTQIGTVIANSSGAWTFTTGTLASGNHSFTSKAMDVAGNTSAASSALVVNVPPSTSDLSAPKIVKFSNDSGVVGDGVTNDNTLAISGTAAAYATVKLFDGTTQVGTAKANGSGAWSITTQALKDGSHDFTAKASDSAGHTSAASSVLAVKIDTTAPIAPKISAFSADHDAANGGATHANHGILTGTAEASSTVSLFDGAKQIGTAVTNDKGVWSYATSTLLDGNHTFTAKAMDAAGNISAASSAMALKVDTLAPKAAFSQVTQNWNDTVTFKGVGEPNSSISIYDNGSTKPIGITKVGSDGTWSFKTSSPVSDVAHNFTASVTDSAGNSSPLSGRASLGTNGNDVLKATSGNDVFNGNGGHDTFQFASNFGADVIKNFGASGRSHDVVEFSKSVFDSFAEVLSHASQHGNDVVIDAGAGNSLTLKNIKLGALDKTDFHFV